MYLCVQGGVGAVCGGWGVCVCGVRAVCGGWGTLLNYNGIVVNQLTSTYLVT